MHLPDRKRPGFQVAGAGVEFAGDVEVAGGPVKQRPYERLHELRRGLL
jgi:hypothetical protein